MSTFECPVVRVRAVEDHPNADRLSINKIGDFNCISNKHDDGAHRYRPGDLVVYIPEGAVVPEWALRRYGYWNEEKNEGFLSGSKKNRVKAVKLRNVVSQGLMFPVSYPTTSDSLAMVELEHGRQMEVIEGENLADALGVFKYEPPIPTEMAGQVIALHGKTLAFDVENLKKYPDAFTPGEQVFVTEKLHGTNVQIGLIPGLNEPDLPRDAFVASKGLAAQGLVFKDNEANAGNLYWRTINQQGIIEKLKQEFQHELDGGYSVYLIGEIYGKGVQDLHYGTSRPEFAGITIWLKSKDGVVSRINPRQRVFAFARMDIPMVPFLYHGEYDRALIDGMIDGKTKLGESNIREGLVVEAEDDRVDHRLGSGPRVAKLVSEDYIFRKNGTELA